MFDVKRMKKDLLEGELVKKRRAIYKKWREETDRAKRRELYEQLKYYPDNEEITHTIYCSIIADHKGKLHMDRVHGSTLFAITRRYVWEYKKQLLDERRHMFMWTEADQKELIKPWIERYTKED